MVNPNQFQALVERLLKNLPETRREPEANFDSPFLRLITSAERSQLLRLFTQRNCTSGEVVFAEGEDGKSLYVIWSGRAAILKGDPNSATVLALRGAGEVIGEMAMLENRPRSATVVAVEPLRLLGLDRLGFQQLLQTSPTSSLSLGLMQTLSARLRQSDDERIKKTTSEQSLRSQVSALQDEKERLEELERLRQETSDLIIHDLRNPLHSINIAVKMLEVTLPEEALEENHDLLEIAHSNIDRMQRLVDSLLEVSRMEGDQIELKLERFDLGEMIKSLLNTFTILERKEVQLVVEIPPDLPPVLADCEKIERVVANLMDNAVKFSRQGETITVVVVLKEGYFEISVTDQGPGIPPGDRQRIFARFSQAAGEKSRQRGFGLGLAYCHLAVEAHGGQIWVEDGSGGVGSRFVFTLPVGDAE